jgi:hypothetical protein
MRLFRWTGASRQAGFGVSLDKNFHFSYKKYWGFVRIADFTGKPDLPGAITLPVAPIFQTEKHGFN